MKLQSKNIFALVALILSFTSCTKDNEETISGTGHLEIAFENTFGNAKLILNSQANTTSQGETLYFSEVKYIISNIVLTKEDGSKFVYPKSQSYFILSQNSADYQIVELDNIPAGNYTQISFGIGVDEAQYNAGQTNQADFFTLAQNEGMASTWSAGYKNVHIKGLFTSSTITTPSEFMIYSEKSDMSYNYETVTLNLVDKALVRTTITPKIHIYADVAKLVDGMHKIKLTDNASGNMGDMINHNLVDMFNADHVHNH